MSSQILIVDDEASMRQLLAMGLSSAGYTVQVAATAEEAIEHLKRNAVPIVIADVVLPGISGMELVTRIKKTYDTDVIVMTGYESAHSYADAIREGASDFVLKPVRIEELRLRVERVAKERRLRETRDRMMAELQELVVTDSLTGLYNSRHFFNQLSVEISRANRYACSLSLVFLDIDHFKKFNDTYGHVAGDSALSYVGNLIKSNLRSIDTAYRYGGEEFVVVLPETSGQDAMIVARRLGKIIADGRFRIESGESVGLTASIGLAQYCAPEDVTSFVQRADRAMYLSKEHGRNTVSALLGPDDAVDVSQIPAASA